MVAGPLRHHDGAMSEQTGPDAGHPGTSTGTRTEDRTPPRDGPRITADQARDLGRLRRSGTDRYVAGVAGGLGRHFDVDPTVVRVLLAVLTFFGGAGVLVYAAVWLFVPEDGSDRAPIDVGPDTRRVVLVVAAALALMIVFGSPFVDGWGSSFPVPLVVLALVAVAVLATRRRRERRTVAPPAPWAGAAAATGAGASSTQTLPVTPVTPGAPTDPTGATAQTGQAPPAWMPPPAPAYVPPPRPRRTGLVLFWPTLALIAIALGTLGILDVSSSVPVSAYAALAVGITGLALLVGAFVGRPGGLIALGLVTTAALVVTSIVGAATGGSTRDEDVRVAPTSTAALGTTYAVGTGSIVVDLSGVRDVAALDGRSLTVTGKAAEVRVVLPAGVNAEVAARVRYAGEIDLGTSSHGGFDFSTTRTLTSSTAPGTPTMDLDLGVRVGRITVEQR
ncbi:MAG: PspC protein [Marmoricola sp.]|nr:PspC protein [Marmoricola sp.]